MMRRSPHVDGVPLDAFDCDGFALTQGPFAFRGERRPDRAVDSDRAFVERAAARFDDRADLTDHRFDARSETIVIQLTCEELLEDRPRRDDQTNRDNEENNHLQGEASDAEQSHYRSDQRADAEPEQKESWREHFNRNEDGGDYQPYYPGI